MSSSPWFDQLFPRKHTRSRRARLGYKARTGRSPGWMVTEALEERVMLSNIIVVNNPTDTPVAGETDLRQAITSANNTSGANTITFSNTVFATEQTITLGGTDLVLMNNTTGTQTITITGPAAGVIVSGGGLSRVLQVDTSVTASISGLTITDGKVTGKGGGLYNEGTTTLYRCTVSGNSASSVGGGLYTKSGGTITLTDCTVSGNTAGAGGGGLYGKGTTTLNYCTVSSNTAVVNGGGGMESNGTFTTTLTGCTFSGNTAVIRGGSVAGYGGTMSLTNCTISGNSITGTVGETGYGGGLWDNGTTTLINCTVSANSTGHSGGGLMVGNGGTMTLGNTIVAGNTAPTTASEDVAHVTGTFHTDGNNLIGDDATGAFPYTTNNNDQIGVYGTHPTPINPMLGTLANNGGPTQTMALLTGSPAIDAGINSIAGAPYHRRARCPAGTDRAQRRIQGRYRRLPGQLVVPGHQHRRLERCRHAPRAVGWANVSTNDNPANISSPAPNTIVFNTATGASSPRSRPSPDQRPAHAEQHEHGGSDHGPGGGRDRQRRGYQPGVPDR